MVENNSSILAEINKMCITLSLHKLKKKKKLHSRGIRSFSLGVNAAFASSAMYINEE